MPVGAKVIVAVAVSALILVFILFVDRGDRGTKDAWMWRGGQGDSFRQAFMKRDGQFHKYAKPMIVAYWIFMIAVLWALPTKD